MGMLGRYHRTGGFLQLLQLIETCEPKKQKKFLQMIEEEDSSWCLALKTRMLSVERILSWNDDVLGDISGQLPDRILAVLLHHFEEAEGQRFFTNMSGLRKRRMQDVYEEVDPNAGEINSALIALVTKVRAMLQEGYLLPERVDPSLMVEVDIEDLLELGRLSSGQGQESPVMEELVENEAGHGINEKCENSVIEERVSVVLMKEVASMKRQIQSLSEDKQRLIDENQSLKRKLQTIGKAA